jgi:nitrate reductase alpha subunit
MKKILLFAGVITCLTTTGCLVSEGGRHAHFRGHERYQSRPELIVEQPVLVVRPPEIIVR